MGKRGRGRRNQPDVQSLVPYPVRRDLRVQDTSLRRRHDPCGLGFLAGPGIGGDLRLQQLALVGVTRFQPEIGS